MMTHPLDGNRWLTLGIVYGVSSTFAWPLLLLLLLWHPTNLKLSLVLVYCLYTYGVFRGGRPERRKGRVWWSLNRFWPVCHGYFPVSLRVWDGSSFSAAPNKRHLRVLPRRAIFAMHPHGPFPLSASLLMPQLARFGSGLLEDIFANLRFAAASAVFWLWLVRDMYLWLGCIEASRSVLTRALTSGLSVAILPGGEHEQLLVCPDDSPFEDVVAPRDGLFHLAITTGTPVVPVFSFGERRSYTSSSFLLDSRLRWVRRHRVGIPWAWGAHWWFPFVPRPGVPITIVVGPAIPVRPVTPDAAGRTILDDSELDARVEDLRRTYMQRVEALFESQKGVDEVAARKKLRWVPRPQPTAKKAR
jgi:1-acyl-sn-glycerol-3-phosphate acyltransferase